MTLDFQTSTAIYKRTNILQNDYMTLTRLQSTFSWGNNPFNFQIFTFGT